MKKLLIKSTNKGFLFNKKNLPVIIIMVLTYGMVCLFTSCKNDQGVWNTSSKQEVQLENLVYDTAEEPIADVYQEDFNTEEYDRIYENPFKLATHDPLSTFSIDVDNASYSNVRRFLQDNQMPPKDAVRIEEMINYFSYNYPQPSGEHPFEIYTEYAECPWNDSTTLVHIGIQGKSLDYDELQPSNLVFLLDASGSMNDRNKLPLVKRSMLMLVNELSEEDKVSIVVYAGAAGLVLPPTPANEKRTIRRALEKLEAGGSTAGGQGIELAYQVAKDNLIEGGNNRVILATDGDFNVGVSSTGDLVRLIEEKRKDDIYLTICGFGMGNYKDGRMEQISNAGNGNYFYIDNIKEAQKVFVKELRANMYTIAKDVKIQVEFNPTYVKAYRLVGYENRVMAKEDFNDDTKDAGELGAGHTVTALYEIVPAGSNVKIPDIDDLKYQESTPSEKAESDELLTLKLRYKPIDSDESLLIEKTINNQPVKLDKSSDEFTFSAAVAGFGMLLRESEYVGKVDYDDVLTMIEDLELKHDDYTSELKSMIETAKLLSDTISNDE